MDDWVPALPAGTQQASAALLDLLGTQTQQQATDATVDGDNLVLDARGQQPSVWAIYEFSCPDRTKYPLSVSVELDSVVGHYYIMYSHFNVNPRSWEISEEAFSGTSATYRFPNHVETRSASNYVYIAVVAGGGNSVEVERVYLNMSTGPSPGSNVDDYLIALPPGLTPTSENRLALSGFETYDRSYASRTGDSMELDATGIQASAWAVYEFLTTQTTHYPQDVAISVTPDSAPYYVLWSNYTISATTGQPVNSWEMIKHPDRDDADPDKYVLTGDFTHDYDPRWDALSSGGRSYIAVMVAGGQSITIDGVTMTISANPAPIPDDDDDESISAWTDALPVGANPAGVNKLYVLGSDEYSKDLRSHADGSSMYLNALDQVPSAWAIYEFTSINLSDYPQTVTVSVTPDTSPYYIMWGNYSLDDLGVPVNSWEKVVYPGKEDTDPNKNVITGDFTYNYDPHWDALSDGGRAYIAVLVAGGHTISVDSLDITMDSTPPPIPGEPHDSVSAWTPGLPAGTTPATANKLTNPGSAYYDVDIRSDVHGTRLNLNAIGQNPSAWAIYEFEITSTEMFPESLRVEVTSGSDDYHILWGIHGDVDSWEGEGPYSGTSTFLYPPRDDLYSPGGRMYAAVIAPGGGYVTVEELALTLSGTPPPIPGEPHESPSHWTPGLPPGDGPSGVDKLFVTGSDYFDKDIRSMADGDNLDLNALDQNPSAWAIYEFTSEDESLYPQYVDVNIAADSDVYHILWPNYHADTWERVGPLTGDYRHNFDPRWEAISDDGRTYFAVIATSGNFVTVESLELVLNDSLPPVPPS